MRRDRPLVIGIGHEHRGDDAAGLLVARALRALIRDSGAADIAEHQGDGAALIELWSGRDWVILVDALRSSGPPGRVLRLDASQSALPVEVEHGSTHAFGVSGAIELARGLGRLPRRIELYGITGSSFSLGSEASSEVLGAARAIAEYLGGRGAAARNATVAGA